MLSSALLTLAAAALAAQGSPLLAQRHATTPTANASAAFPTDVGFLGTTIAGLESPILVNTDTLLNSTVQNAAIGPSSYERRWRATDDDESGSFDIWSHLGNTSPYASSRLFNETRQYNDLEPGCSVKGVHMLQRHGARFPTSSTSEGAPFFGATIRNATNLNATGPLSFLNDYSYTLGAELLVPAGRQQLFDAGVKAFYRYGALYNASTQPHLPVVRTTSQSRMLQSAQYWTMGFFGIEAPSLVNLEVILEGGSGLGTPDAFNNTLASYDTCTNSDNITIGDTYLTGPWRDIYLADAVERLQPYVTGLNLTTKLLYGAQSLCAYETQAIGYSPFCGLFTKAEWEGFEYFLDLQFQGDYGFMSPTGKAQGIGYVQEMLARITNGTSPPADPVTTQNTTLNNNPTYFPVDQPFYFDFTHDDIIVSVLTALNFTVFADFLSPDAIQADRSFVLSSIAPFAGRLFFEIIDCASSNSTNSDADAKPTQYIRTVLNDALVPMGPDVGCVSTTPNPTLCLLDDFVTYQNRTAVEAANFDKACFGVNGTDFTVTGPVRNGTVY